MRRTLALAVVAALAAGCAHVAAPAPQPPVPTLRPQY